jgi:hypothetical protein
MVSDLRIGKLGTFSGPVNDVPRLIKPDEVVANLLWTFLLPELPVRRIEFDELLSSAFDDLTLLSGEENSDDAMPENLVQALVKRGAVRRLDFADEN